MGTPIRNILAELFYALRSITTKSRMDILAELYPFLRREEIKSLKVSIWLIEVNVLSNLQGLF